ncbi:MAG: DUF2242 domain-containing protein [Rubrivivax sp.]|nr:DUF2242 domain-containing protein [Rubrivivax sp.]
MTTMPRHFLPVAVALAAFVFTGCAMTDASMKALAPVPPVHQAERFDAASPHARRHERSAADLCEAARRALMSQGYVLTRNDRAVLVGRKYFQPEKERHVELQLQVTCVAEGADDRAGSVYVTAWEDQYVVKKSGTSSSLGVSALGSISLPIGGSEESLVKVGVATVRDPGFYERFHQLLVRQLQTAR